jgi:hypothetical protein
VDFALVIKAAVVSNLPNGMNQSINGWMDVCMYNMTYQERAERLDHVELIVKLMTFIFVEQINDLNRMNVNQLLDG